MKNQLILLKQILKKIVLSSKESYRNKGSYKYIIAYIYIYIYIYE